MAWSTGTVRQDNNVTAIRMNHLASHETRPHPRSQSQWAVGLMRQDGKRPDGTTILPWFGGKPLAWDVTVPDTYMRTNM